MKKIIENIATIALCIVVMWIIACFADYQRDSTIKNIQIKYINTQIELIQTKDSLIKERNKSKLLKEINVDILNRCINKSKK